MTQRGTCKGIARATYERGVDPSRRGEINQVVFVRKNEIEHGGQERRIACGLAQVLRTEAAFGQKAAKASSVPGNVGERLGGDCRSLIGWNFSAFRAFRLHFHFRNE
jgi:hypothetical protein